MDNRTITISISMFVLNAKIQTLKVHYQRSKRTISFCSSKCRRIYPRNALEHIVATQGKKASEEEKDLDPQKANRKSY